MVSPISSLTTPANLPQVHVEHAEHKALRSEIPTIPSSPTHHEMNPFRGFMAVTFACMTSGLAGVYFEMVLKGTKADLWTRNIQLSFFSLIPALVPVLFNSSTSHGLVGALVEPFANFSVWAWATVLTQVLGGLVTAIVIKYSDNILKGFATSLSIILSFLASVLLFAYPITPAFLIGSIVVLSATWMYNQPEPRKAGAGSNAAQSRMDVAVRPGSPIRPDAPIIGETPKPSRTPSVASLIGLANSITRSSTPTATPHGDHLQPSSMPYPSGSGYYTPSNMSPFPSSQSLTLSITPPNLSPATSHGFTPRYAQGTTTPTGTSSSSSYRPPIQINTSAANNNNPTSGGLYIHLPETVEESIPSSPYTATTSYSGPGGVLRDSPVRERKGSLAARTQRPVVDIHHSYDKMR
jgi:UDP-sugar transporter A1/2/3